MIRVTLVGFGNVGRFVYEAIKAAPDLETACIVKPSDRRIPEPLRALWAPDIQAMAKFGPVDAAILCAPSRLCPGLAEEFLSHGIHTVDSFDIHGDIWDTKVKLDAAAKKHGAVAVLSAGWDPGTDSVVRALMEAMAPHGLTYTGFGPGMSMGHTVAAKAVPGVKNALSVTIPIGAGLHRRMVYVELCGDHTLEDVAARVKADPYFAHDETHVTAVEDVNALIDMGSGVDIERKAVSGGTHNQRFGFTMAINNPALTGQILVCAARAAMKQVPGCYTLIEIPPIDLLYGSEEELVRRLV